MTRSKKLLSLFAVLAAAVLVYALCLSLGADNDKSGIELTKIKANNITEIWWEYSGAEVTLTKENGLWHDALDADYPINQDTVGKMLSTFTEERASTAIADGDCAAYGIDPDSPNVRLTLDDESEVTLSFGDTNDIVNQCYLKLSNDECIYLVETALRTAFETERGDLLQTEEIPYLSEIDSICITAGGETMELTAEPDAGGGQLWSCGETALDSDKTEELADGIRNIAWNECAEYKADAAKAAEYGFDNPRATVKWGNDEQTINLEFGNTTPDGGIYARIHGSDMIYTVDGSVEEYLTTDCSSFIRESETENTDEE